MVTHKAGQRYLNIFTRLIFLLITLFVVLFYWHNSSADNQSFELNPTVHFFSQDTAPMDGEIAIFVNYGMENRPEGQEMANWDIREGQPVDELVKLSAMRYARTWFSPDGTDDWYLLPSQYWHEGGSCKDEFGVSPRNEHPSYHTYFEDMIHQDDVPQLKRLDECPFGSSDYCPQNTAHDGVDPSTGSDGEPVPTATPAPTPTACIVLKQDGISPCPSD